MSKPKEPKQVKKQYSNLSHSIGINLIPPRTQQEVQLETTKSTVNVGAAVAVLLLVVLSIVIIGYNVISKFNLDDKKEGLYALEEVLNARKATIVANNEILSRIDLYEDIQESTYNSKDVIEYWNYVSSGMAEITKIELSGNLGFSINGSADDLTEVAKLWYLLANDEHVDEINLESVVKTEDLARFQFEGIINFESFK